MLLFRNKINFESTNIIIIIAQFTRFKMSVVHVKIWFVKDLLNKLFLIIDEQLYKF